MKTKILLTIAILQTSFISLPIMADPGGPFTPPVGPRFWVCNYSHSKMIDGIVMGNIMVPYAERTVFGYACPRIEDVEPEIQPGVPHRTVNVSEQSPNGSVREGHTINNEDCRVRLVAQPQGEFD